MLNLVGQYNRIKEEIDSAIKSVLESGHYIMGPQVEEFEQNMAEFLGVKHAIGVASGSDALLLSLHALGIGLGDKVIVPTFTFFATAGAVSRLGGIPVFVDVDPATYNLDLDMVEDVLRKERGIKAIIPVHLFGLPCDMARVRSLAEEYDLKVVEDACQAINADIPSRTANDYPNKGGSVHHAHQRSSASLIQKAGTIGDTGCFSFFPSKNLGGAGDGGMVVTSDDDLAERIRILRVHGSKPKYHHHVVGYNSRLDTVQAAVLNVKLRYLNEWTQKRQAVARLYNQAFQELGLTEKVKHPHIVSGHVFHQYVIEVDSRDELVAYLQHKGIDTAIYYPIPLHLQPCFQCLGYRPRDLPAAEQACKRVLALPIDPEMNADQVGYVVESIREFVTLPS